MQFLTSAAHRLCVPLCFLCSAFKFPSLAPPLASSSSPHPCGPVEHVWTLQIFHMLQLSLLRQSLVSDLSLRYISLSLFYLCQCDGLVFFISKGLVTSPGFAGIKYPSRPWEGSLAIIRAGTTPTQIAVLPKGQQVLFRVGKSSVSHISNLKSSLPHFDTNRSSLKFTRISLVCF